MIDEGDSQVESATSFHSTDSSLDLKWGWIEIFIIIQFLSPGILMLPGAQVIRLPVRVLPYFFSVVLFFVLFRQREQKNAVPRAPASTWLVFALVVMCFNLFHPTTILYSGLAQFAFQLTIIGPIFWTMFVSITPDRLERILWICLWCNALSAIVGALQVYYPEIFLPAEFTSAHSLEYLSSLSFEGVNRIITRPPGLSDVPSGAATGAAITSFLALFFSTKKRCSLWVRVLLMVLVLVSFFTLYLTQVRSQFLCLIAAIIALAILRLRGGEGARGFTVIIFSAGLVAGAFMLAVGVGGDTIEFRYLDLAETGLIESFQQNRGQFLQYTLERLLWEYPLGSGMGRWGMMYSYFGQNPSISALWAEIQVTGWLFDGGIPLCFLYLGAIIISLLAVYRISVRNPDSNLAMAARGIFCLNLMTAANLLAGPSFNTQNGMIFWALYGLLFSSAFHSNQVSKQLLKSDGEML